MNNAFLEHQELKISCDSWFGPKGPKENKNKSFVNGFISSCVPYLNKTPLYFGRNVLTQQDFHGK